MADALDALPSTTDPSTVLAETSQAGKFPVSESQFPGIPRISCSHLLPYKFSIQLMWRSCLSIKLNNEIHRVIMSVIFMTTLS